MVSVEFNDSTNFKDNANSKIGCLRLIYSLSKYAPKL